MHECGSEKSHRYINMAEGHRVGIGEECVSDLGGNAVPLGLIKEMLWYSGYVWKSQTAAGLVPICEYT